MARKTKAFEEPGSAAAAGHNKPDLEQEYRYATSWAEIEKKKIELGQKQKDLLNKAKDEGHLKTPIKTLGKEMISNPEKLQSKREVEKQTNRLRKYAADNHGQLHLFDTVEDSEAA